jgi:hypothetical protein
MWVTLPPENPSECPRRSGRREAPDREGSAPLDVLGGYEPGGGGGVHPVCAGLVLPMPLLLSHS